MMSSEASGSITIKEEASTSSTAGNISVESGETEVCVCFCKPCLNVRERKGRMQRRDNCKNCCSPLAWKHVVFGSFKNFRDVLKLHLKLRIETGKSLKF